MSLVRLLSVGQSLQSFARGSVGFRSPRSAALPKFGGQPKFASSVGVNASPFKFQSPTVPIVSPPPLVPPLLAQRTPVGNPPGALKVGKPSLDAVKVMRNELEDSDLEVVRSQPAPKAVVRPEVERSEPGPSAVQIAGTVWNRLTGRLFEAGRVKLRV